MLSGMVWSYPTLSGQETMIQSGCPQKDCGTALPSTITTCSRFISQIAGHLVAVSQLELILTQRVFFLFFYKILSTFLLSSHHQKYLPFFFC